MPPPLTTLGDALGTRTGLRLLRWAVIALLAASLGACVANGANGPEDPRLASRSRVDGFGEVAFRVSSGTAQALPSVDTRCALLAETEAQRAQGLMGRRDLAGYDAMVFRFPLDTTAAFYMRNVPVSLTVAWFDAGGRFVGAADMEPCGNRDECPLYSPGAPYRLAIEVPPGGLDRLGVGPGSVLTLEGPCRRR